ncbi:hypothetical protein C455_08522 [Haloferax larsenii JCM 13917]|nr:hypothetical protein [Haloferax larsenii]ELZ79615.1 hypothetical protein C455_08522 [Haloferax larsenii JCM 13917]
MALYWLELLTTTLFAGDKGTVLAPFVPANGTTGGTAHLVFIVAANLFSESYSYLVEHIGTLPVESSSCLRDG